MQPTLHDNVSVHQGCQKPLKQEKRERKTTIENLTVRSPTCLTPGRQGAGRRQKGFVAVKKVSSPSKTFCLREIGFVSGRWSEEIVLGLQLAD